MRILEPFVIRRSSILTSSTQGLIGSVLISLIIKSTGFEVQRSGWSGSEMRREGVSR